MKTKVLSSFFVLFAIVAGIITMTPAAFADHPEVTIGTVEGSGFGQDCVAEGCYTPSIATVDVGGKVIFSNTDTTGIHTFTAGTVDGFTPSPTGEFDTSIINSGETAEWTPEEAGEVPYYCTLHTWMIGTIIVEGESRGDHDDSGDHNEPGDDKTMMRDGDASATGMLSDATMVSIWTSAPTAGEMMDVSIEFDDAKHVNYDIMVTQNGEEVLNDEGAHEHDGKGDHTTAPLSSSDPVDIKVTFQGYGVSSPKTGPIGEEVAYSNIVPEFGTIAMMILAVAIISIIAVTAKSRVIPRF